MNEAAQQTGAYELPLSFMDRIYFWTSMGDVKGITSRPLIHPGLQSSVPDLKSQ